jgi:hypothetical protein
MFRVTSKESAKLLIDGARANGLHLAVRDGEITFISDDGEESEMLEAAQDLLDFIYTNNSADEEDQNPDVIEYVQGQIEDLPEMA